MEGDTFVATIMKQIDEIKNQSIAVMENWKDIIKPVVEKLTSKDAAVLCGLGVCVTGVCYLFRAAIKVLGQ